MEDSLFGADFNIELPKPKVKDLVKKLDAKAMAEADAEKILKSNKLSIHERLGVIRDRVIKILGKQRQNVIVIRSLDDFSSYIDRALEKGVIAIDTETNNSLDPVTCQLMGLCLYVPGEKQAYIPINHVNVDTGERLAWQLTETHCRDQLLRIVAAKTFVIMHNGKFDYEVLKATCNVAVIPHWDTQIAARLLDENESARLKDQYITKIDPTQAKYDIENLFDHIQYALVDPEIFALYAATDSLMTYKLYEYQVPQMTASDMSKVYWVFLNIEMPIVVVTAEMELRGVSVNAAFGKKLKLKYKQLLEDIDGQIALELDKLKNTIDCWKVDPERGGAIAHIYMPKKSKKSLAELEATYNMIEPDMIPSGKVDRTGSPILKHNPNAGKRFKYGKKLADMLGNPINLASSTQLAILFYDILKCPTVSKKSPRGTGEAELEAILEKKPDLTLCKLILKRRGIVKLITTYIDVIPSMIEHWPDRRIRFHLNSMGTDTGRYSSGGKLKFFENGKPVVISGLNIQNIPSRGDKSIRMLFQGDTLYHTIQADDSDDWFEVPETDEVETPTGWKFVSELELGDIVTLSNDSEDAENWQVQEIKKVNKLYKIKFRDCTNVL